MFVRIAVCIFIRAACGTRTHNVLHGKEICYHCINAALAEVERLELPSDFRRSGFQDHALTN